MNIFLTAPLIDQITNNTNTYATEEIAGRERGWRGLLAVELHVWLIIVVYVGMRTNSEGPRLLET